MEWLNGRGSVAEITKEHFLEVDHDETTMMEVLVSVALKTMSNYLDHLGPISIDPAFQRKGQLGAVRE
jgi:hypothetical protein